MHAYKHGQYQRSLQLSTQNIRTLIGHPGISLVLLYPEFTQLIDDDIVSVLALTLIVDPSRLDSPLCVSVNQLTMSVYLMVKCQMQLHHSVTSLAQSLHCQAACRRRHEPLAGIICSRPRGLSRRRPHHDCSALLTLLRALVVSKVDCYSTVLAGVSLSLTDRLQSELLTFLFFCDCIKFHRITIFILSTLSQTLCLYCI